VTTDVKKASQSSYSLVWGYRDAVTTVTIWLTVSFTVVLEGDEVHTGVKTVVKGLRVLLSGLRMVFMSNWFHGIPCIL
jgi:hypothetical protein